MNKVIAFILVVLVILLLTSGVLVASPATKAGGEILHKSKEGTLYRCGPEYEDLCWASGNGVTKIYFGGD